MKRIQQGLASNPQGRAVVGYDFLKRTPFAVSNADFLTAALHLAEDIQSKFDLQKPIALFGNKTLEYYLGVVATWFAGGHFLPLHPETPAQRLKEILLEANTEQVLYDPLTKITVDAKAHKIEFNPSQTSGFSPAHRTSQQLAYIIFTSGSSGKPKGIAVQDQAVLSYFSEISQIIPVNHQSVLAQNFECSFDPSIGDILWAFANGACLRPIQFSEYGKVASIMTQDRITHWGSSPSLAKMVLESEKSSLFGSLQYSSFIGEKLTRELAQRWLARAPNSQIFNLYGPAETTISVSAHRYNNDPEEIVPIGKPHSQSEFILIEGELWIGGSQLALGYLDQQNTTARFIDRVFPHHQSHRWYKTGDLCAETNGIFHFKGRSDLQIKIQGQRFEIEEIQNRLLALGIDAQVFQTNENQLVAVVLELPHSTDELNTKLAETLPAFAIPRHYYKISAWPLSQNAKVDRLALITWLENKPL